MTSLNQTFWQWLASLSEFAPERYATAYCAELFSMYCSGATPAQAAQAIREIDGMADV